MNDSPQGGDGYDPNHDKDNNIIKMPTLAERDKMRREAEKAEKRAFAARQPKEQLINLPPVTKYMLGLFIVIFIGVNVLAPKDVMEWILLHFGFTPGAFTGRLVFEPIYLITPLTHMFLHGSWLHIGMNGVMLMAFGAGIERWVGGRRMVIFFILCGLCGALAHFALNPFSIYPVIGASGGLSGFFAAALIMINKNRAMAGPIGAGRYGLWPFIILWIAISVLFGMMGGPDGSPVAWAAHVGGFVGGFAVAKLMRFY